MIRRAMPLKLAVNRINATATSAKAIVHNEFSITAEEIGRNHRVPRPDLGERNQRHDELGNIFGGVRMRDPPKFAQNDEPLNGETKSASVATDRPTSTLESQVLNRQIRSTSARGSKERNAQPRTYTALSSASGSAAKIALRRQMGWRGRRHAREA